MLATLLLPESKASAELVERIVDDLKRACQSVGAALVGGHTEITSGLDRPILVGAMIGEVTRERLVTPRGAQPGDRLLLTKGAPIEATAILAREFGERLLASGAVDKRELETARRFLYNPGISVLRDAQIAIRAGDVHAMHDPTEGGLLTALWELAQACQHSLWVDLQSVQQLSQRICQALRVDPLAAIASGALLLAVAPSDAQAVCNAMLASGIDCAEIGVVLDEPGEPAVWSSAPQKREPVPLPERDAIAALFET
jgi:hydrogenase maturation factor